MSIPSAKTIDISILPDSSNLFVDYTSRRSRNLIPYLDEIPDCPDIWRKRLESSLESREEFFNRINIDEYKAMVQKLIDYNRMLGAAGGIIDKMKKAVENKACFIVTGQQPGVLGGSLMVLYKAVTAIALSERIEKILSIDCIPLFWIGSDDSDFQEIKSLFVLSDDMSVKMTTLPSQAHESSRPIGGISPRWCREVWEMLKPSLSQYGGYDYVHSAVERALESGGDHAEVTSILLLKLLSGKLAIVDGREGSLRSFSRKLFIDYLENEEAIKTSLRKTGEELRQHGYHSQITVASDSGIFLMIKGRRTKVPIDSIGELRSAIVNSIESCSPGVVLRNLVQDYSLMPLAVVLGPAELAYRAQMYEIYRILDVPKPMPIPRMTATFLPEKIAEEFLRAGVASDLIVANPHEAAELLFARIERTDARDAAEEFLSMVNENSSKLKKKLQNSLSPGTLSRLEKQLDAATNRLNKIFNLVDESAKGELIKTRPWLKDVENLVRPRNRAQERLLSMLLPFLFNGEKGTDLQIELGRGHVDNLLSGRIGHVLYTV